MKISVPAMAGPATLVALLATPSSELAVGRPPASTVPATRGKVAGTPNAAAAPAAAAAAATGAMARRDAVPVAAGNKAVPKITRVTAGGGRQCVA